MVRRLSPGSTIVVGGHVTAIPDIENMIDADHIVRGEGVPWMRRYLGEEENAPIRHPAIALQMRTLIMGIRRPSARARPRRQSFPRSAVRWLQLLHHVSFFGGKGKFVNFFESGDELFEVMQQIEEKLRVHSFFVMDENFPLHRDRAMRLLERLKEAGKSWTMSVFASANAIGKYTMQELVELGASWL